MLITVTPHKVIIDKDIINEREIDITKCEFEFADEITDDFVKQVLFTFKGKTYEQIIVDNECKIPYEVLTEKGQVEIGVVAFKTDGVKEIKFLLIDFILALFYFNKICHFLFFMN